MMPTTKKQDTPVASIQNIHYSDATSLACTMMSAFHEDPLWASLWSPHMKLEDVVKDCVARMPWNLVKAGVATPISKRFQKAVDGTSGKAVGYARWRLPASCIADSTGICWSSALPPIASEDERRVYKQQFQAVTTEGVQIQGLDHQREADLSRSIEEAEQRLVGNNTDFLGACLINVVMVNTRPLTSPLCTELEYLAVHPSHQRRGIGRLLLLEALAIADQLGVKTLVIAKNAGVKLYQAHGFCEVDKVVQYRPEYGWEAPHVTTFLV